MAVLGIIIAVILLIILGIIIYAVTIYNGLVTVKNNVDKTWSNIDVLLKQRYDEIPKLIKVCERYMLHEAETLEKVTKARNMMNDAKTMDERGEAENVITGALKSLFAVSENYPDLKADKSFLNLQHRISELENEISDRRELFNASVNIHNIRIQQFPDVIIANTFGYKEKALWQIDPAHREDVEVKFSR